MRKLVAAAALLLAFSPAFAAYTLTVEDQKLIDSFTQKAQQKPVRYQESVISLLKNAQTSNQDERKLALFQAIENKLRKQSRDSSGQYNLATQLERAEIKKALFQDAGVETTSGTMNISGNLRSTMEPNVITFDTKIITDVDLRESENPKIRLRIDGSGAVDSESASASAEIRIVDKQLFLKLAQLSIVSSSGLDFAPFIEPYLGKWYREPMSDGDVNDITVKINGETLAWNEKQELVNTLLNTNFIPNLHYIGQKDGISSYSGFLDTRMLLNSIREASLAQGNAPDAEDMKKLEEIIKHVSVWTTFSLDKNGEFTAFSILITFKNAVSQGSGAVINGSIALDVATIPFTGDIIAPENAHNLD